MPLCNGDFDDSALFVLTPIVCTSLFCAGLMAPFHRKVAGAIVGAIIGCAIAALMIAGLIYVWSHYSNS